MPTKIDEAEAMKVQERAPDPERDRMLAELAEAREKQRRAAEGIARAQEMQRQEVLEAANAIGEAIMAFYRQRTGDPLPQIDGYVVMHALTTVLISHATKLEREASVRFLAIAATMLLGPVYNPIRLPDPAQDEQEDGETGGGGEAGYGPRGEEALSS